jgi:hypothetical protein
LGRILTEIEKGVGRIEYRNNKCGESCR